MAMAKTEACRTCMKSWKHLKEIKKIYRISKNRNKVSKDIHHVRKKIQRIWKEYSRGLLNEENPEDHDDDVTDT